MKAETTIALLNGCSVEFFCSWRWRHLWVQRNRLLRLIVDAAEGSLPGSGSTAGLRHLFLSHPAPRTPSFSNTCSFICCLESLFQLNDFLGEIVSLYGYRLAVFLQHFSLLSTRHYIPNQAVNSVASLSACILHHTLKLLLKQLAALISHQIDDLLCCRDWVTEWHFLLHPINKYVIT